MFRSKRTVFRSTENWPESLDRAMERLAETVDRVFGSDFMSEAEEKADKAARKPKKKSPGFTTPGRLAVDGRIPRWASPWVAMIHHNLPNFEVIGQPTQVQRACEILETLLLAGFTPPNADTNALERWREHGDASPKDSSSSTNESATAKEAANGTENPSSQKETPGTG